MLSDWDTLSDQLQLLLSQKALRVAAGIIARQAELLAEELESGAWPDRGGPDTLRSLATFVRMNGTDILVPVPSMSCH